MPSENVKLENLNLRKSVQEILSSATNIKKILFKSVIMKEPVDRYKAEKFESDVNNFLLTWSNRIDEIRSLLKNANDVDPTTPVLIDYNSAKTFIYNKFDYASVLQFADGLIQGVEFGDLDTVDEIENFRIHTTTSAFNNLPPELEDLLDMADPKESGKMPTSLDVKLFETVKGYNDLFKYTERVELYKAVTQTISYFIKGSIIPSTSEYNKVRLYILLLNNVVDYIVYSLTVYAIKVNIIYNYILPFVTKVTVEAVTDMSLDDVTENPSGNTSNVFQITDEMLIKDPSKYKELSKKFYDFIELTSGKKLSKDLPTYYNDKVSKKQLASNRFYDKLKNNHLYNFIVDTPENNEVLLFDTPPRYEEYKHLLKDAIINTKHGSSNTYSSRHEFLYILKDTECNYKNLNDCRDCALDLYVIFILLSKNIARQIFRMNNWHNKDMEEHYLNLSDRKSLTEIASLLSSLYSEVIFIIVQRAGFLERVINELNKTEAERILGNFSIKIPDFNSLDTVIDGASDATLQSVPNTTRNINHSLDSNAMSTFEVLEFYDEYLKSLPEFKDNVYFSEAVNGQLISSFFNKIVAFIQGLFKKAKAFYNNEKFKAAQTWVANNKNKLLAAKFDKEPPNPEDIFTVLDYKDNISIQSIFDFNKLKAFIDNTDVAAVANDLASWKNKCYESFLTPDSLKIFVGNESDINTKSRQYKNLYLYNPNSIKQDGTPGNIEVNSNAVLSKLINLWISNILGATTLLQQLNTMESNFNTMTNTLKGKVATAMNASANTTPNAGTTPNSSTTPNADATPNTGAGAAGATPNAGTTPNTAGNDDKGNASNVSGIVNIYQEILTNAVLPILPFTIEVLSNQYKYIQLIYTKATKGQ